MAQIQGYKRIIVEDFQEKDRDLAGKLAGNINIAFEEIIGALTKNITVGDNLNLNQRTFTVTVDSSGNPVTITKVASNLSSSTAGISVIRAQNQTTSTVTPTGQPFISFTDNSGIITINNITGLQASNQYVLTVILWPS